MKKITETKTRLNPSKSGWTPISKVVAAVLGIARSGPKHIIIAEPKTIENFSPALDIILVTLPLHLAAAKIARSAKPTSANTNPKNPIWWKY